MKTFEFTLVLGDLKEVTGESAEKIFEAGCDGGTFTSSNGEAEVQFDREAATLEAAVESAISQIESVGFTVAKVESDEFATIHRFNEQLAQV